MKLPRPISTLCCAIALAVSALAANALDLVRDGRVDDAVATLQQRLAATPSDADAANLLGRAYYQAERWDEAISAFQRAVQTRPDNSEYHMWLARAYGEKADSSSFLSAFDFARKFRSEMERAVELNPRNVEARTDLAEFYASAPGVVGGGRDKALAQAGALASIDSAAAASIRAMVAEKDKKYDDAENNLRAAIAASKNPARGWLNLASFYRRIGRAADSENAVLKAVSLGKKDGVLADAASILFRAGRNFPAAAEYLREYINSGPHSEESPVIHAHFTLGSLLEKQGDRKGAADQYRAALALAHNYSKAQAALKRVQ